MMLPVDEQRKKALRRRLDRALKLRGEARDAEAEQELLALLEETEGLPLVKQILAETYFLMDRYEDALWYGLEAVRLRPTSIGSSLTVFHCLHSLGREEDAYREMVRFMKLRRSEEYDKLAEGLAGNPAFEKAKREAAKSE